MVPPPCRSTRLIRERCTLLRTDQKLEREDVVIATDVSGDLIRNTELLAVAVFTFATAWISQRTKKTTEEIKKTNDKIHVIVNSGKTKAMEDTQMSRLANLTMAKLLLKDHPDDPNFIELVRQSQEFYDRITYELNINKQEGMIAAEISREV